MILTGGLKEEEQALPLAAGHCPEPQRIEGGRENGGLRRLTILFSG